ncbi:hypothetical protein BGX29_011486 [Mortierella sp. GBA35]|nr:hypothetical protein BGX23_001523 [Mortierella sp. AD031]KAF9090429.1 hypothetical protein BGX29_011486 [Mortierella sp. GBA35]KAG0218477.1 hypothetical protein BGX33_007259 [Mortierella sp. NVP41]
MKSLAESYNPQQGPAFGQLTREDISKVVKKEDINVVVWSIGKRPKDGFPAKPKVIVPVVVPTQKELDTQQDSAVQTPADATITETTTTATTDGQDESSTEPAAPAAPVKPKSWAELLRSKTPVTPSPAAAVNGTAAQKPVELNKATSVNGVKFDGIADVLHKFQPTYSSVLIQPRGLVNNGNMCFMNAIGKHVVHSFKSKTPLVDSLIMFLNEFHVAKKNQPDYGPPFVPEYVYDALRGLKRFDSMRGRQEDCQEFLGFLLDGLHEEFFAAMKEKPLETLTNGEAEHEEDESGVSEDEWMEVTGPKNKASYTRSIQFSETPISTIFSGHLRSILRIPSRKDSVTLEPFQSMQLDLTPDNVHTIEDALLNSTIPEVLDGFTSSDKGDHVEATKKIFIEEVPPVLVLHLKRFIYKDGSTQKLHKQVGYKTVLNLQPDIISPARRPANPIPYKLFGVVYHHGRTAAGGHYTCDVLRQNAEWLHIDDTNITVISEADVTVDDHAHPANETFKPAMNGTLTNGAISESAALAAALSASSVAASRSSDGVAYVLFYIRSDQKGAAMTEFPTPNSSGSHSKPTTNGSHNGKAPASAWSIPKK